MSIENLAQYLGAIEDPRCSGKVGHRLLDILVIAVCAVIACAESWCDIALYGRSKLAWLRRFLELPNGIPSHDTVRRVFMLIDPDAFEAGFTAWVGSLVAGFEREVVAIDGKTLRRSFDHGREQSPLHLVSAWASEQGLVLGQRCVDGKSNEITAIPALLDQLALQNSIVTLDAMGCQTAIAEKILARGGDYLLTLPLCHSSCRLDRIRHPGGAGRHAWLATDRSSKTRWWPACCHPRAHRLKPSRRRSASVSRPWSAGAPPPWRPTMAMPARGSGPRRHGWRR